MVGDFTGLVEAVSTIVVSWFNDDVSAGAVFTPEVSEVVVLSLPPEQLINTKVEDIREKSKMVIAVTEFLFDIL